MMMSPFSKLLLGASEPYRIKCIIFCGGYKIDQLCHQALSHNDDRNHLSLSALSCLFKSLVHCVLIG